MDGERIPIPATAIEMFKRNEAKRAIDAMQLELVLLKHLVQVLDPTHNYLMNFETMELVKQKSEVPNGEDEVQPGDSENKPPEGETPVDGGAKGLHEFSGPGDDLAPREPEGDTPNEVQPRGDQEGA